MAYRNRFRSSRLKCAFIIILVPLIYTLRCMVSKPHVVIKEQKSRDLANVVVHIDFKGSPVNLSYLKALLPKLGSLGVTGLLMEYEDMFPYEGNLVNLSAKYRYEQVELRNFLEYAVEEGFDIIPLIQTFGHMEHVLKLAEFEHLREIPFYPDSICPSKADSLSLVRDMLEQVIKFHTDIFPLKYFHIGCDEVFHINECEDCKNRGLLHFEIYLSHVKAVTGIVNELTPETVVLIWDDMFRDIPINLWQTLNATGVEPVYWDYSPTITVSHINMMKYHTKFKNIWIASAYKGADGRMTTFPDLLKRFYNHFGWMKFISDYKFGGENDVYHFRGIILTGWSRYSHMDPPCDLLQVALPSLFLNLLFIRWSTINKNELIDGDLNEIFTNHIHTRLMKELNCTDLINLEYFDDKKCEYDDSCVYRALTLCEDLITDINTYINDIDKGLLGVNYYSKFNFINRNQVGSHIHWCNKTFNDLLFVESNLKNTLARYYDSYFIEEYINYRLYDTKVMLLSLFNSLQNMLLMDENWQRKPFAREPS